MHVQGYFDKIWFDKVWSGRFNLCFKQTLLPSPPWGRSPCILKQTIDVEIQQPHQPTRPLPTWEGRGDRSNQHADQSSQSGAALTTSGSVEVARSPLGLGDLIY